MGASEWTDPLVAQDPTAVRMPAVDDLSPLMWRAMPLFLVGDDETFGRPGADDVRNAFRLVDKAVREYRLGSRELRQVAVPDNDVSVVMRVIQAQDHLETMVNAMHRACKLLSRLKNNPRVPLGREDLLRPAEVRQIGQLRHAAEHVDEWVRNEKLAVGQPVMMQTRCEGLEFADESLSYAVIAQWLRKLHGACLKVIEGEPVS
jgi:hypothetical protein